jgi:hypothetical protein
MYGIVETMYAIVTRQWRERPRRRCPHWPIPMTLLKLQVIRFFAHRCLPPETKKPGTSRPG